MARFLVAVFAFMLAAIAAVSFRSQRDAYRRDAIGLQVSSDAACEQLAQEIDDIGLRLDDPQYPIGTDAGGPGFVELRSGLGLREDGTLTSARTYSWNREYLACGANRAWSTVEMSDDAKLFADEKIHAGYAKGPALVTLLHDMSARVRAVKARPFRHASNAR